MPDGTFTKFLGFIQHVVKKTENMIDSELLNVQAFL